MTDYIEEMMKIAEVKPKYKYLVKGQIIALTVDKSWLIWKFKNRKNKSAFKVSAVEKYYPDFTPEKQLEIIKQIGKTQGSFGLAFYSDGWCCQGDRENGFFITVCENQDFTQALAQLTVELMKAGELDKEKVKEILENEAL